MSRMHQLKERFFLLCYASALIIFNEYLVMAAVTFDTHEFVKKLMSAGFSEAQAEKRLLKRREIL